MRNFISFILILFVSFPLLAQLKITGVVDGPLSGGVPKSVEFYVMANIADLSVFGFGSANNGGGSDGEEYTFPAVSATAGTYIYVASEATGFNTFFGFNPDYTSSAASINGDDAIELFMNGSVVDLFGDINVDGTGQPWEYLDGWAKRVDGSGPSSSFVLANWTFSGPNALDGETSNSTAATPFPMVIPPMAQLKITGVVDGPLSGGVPKSVEFYVMANIADLSVFGFGSANNGGGSDGEEYTFPAVSATAGTYIYVASEATGFNTFFGFNPDYTSSAASINGDDAIELFMNGSVVDLFGDINVDGTGQPWEYLDGWAKRVDGSGPSSSFVLANWTFSGPNALDGETSNSTAATPFPMVFISSDWVINEIHADPVSGLAGDANGDGVRESGNDEFVELINISAGAIDISGWTISDGVGVKHTFPAGTIVPSFAPVVIFGGGAPTGTFGGAIVQTASTGNLSLNNSGDVVTLKNGTADVVSYSYSSEGGSNQSITRDPDLTGADPLIQHSVATGSAGTIFSPGTKIDGSLFPGATLPTPFVINEIHADPAGDITGDANGDGTRNSSQDEFVELINNSGGSLDISGWTISDAVGVRHTFPPSTIVPDLCAVVIFGGGTPTGMFGGALVQTASSGLLGLNNTGDNVTLKNGTTEVVSYTYGSEGNDNQSLTRYPEIIGSDPLIKHSTVTGSDGALFSPGLKVDGSFFPGCPQMVEIYEIQGSGLSSPYKDFNVSTEDNVVTAISTNGFFMQTPESRTDGDQETSDGIFVFTDTPPTVAVGDLVDVTGKVDEFFDFTEIMDPDVSTVGTSPLPVTIELDGTSPSPVQPQSDIELEKYEGMLISIENGIVTGPTQRFGTDPIAEAYIVASPNRTYRESGIEFPGISGYPIWDGNLEVFELDPDKMGLLNQAITAGSTFKADGVLGYEFGGYEIWPTSLTIDPVELPISVRSANVDEVTVGSLNLFRLFDTESNYTDRLNKFSMYIRNVLNSPDILAVQEANSILELQGLASKIIVDDPTIVYTAFLEEGSDIGGIDVGFLVRTDKVLVNSISQQGKNETYTNPETNNQDILHDRPPLLLDGSFIVNGNPNFSIFVMAVHNRSLSGIETERVQVKRKVQAESIAQKIQTLQNVDPNAHIIVTGDFNAFEFTDGYVDAVGIISGNFSASQSIQGGTDYVNPNLTNQVLSLSANERYSFIFRGTSQVLDHSLTSLALNPKVSGLQFGRGNADAPVDLLNDDSTPLRSSDHDGIVLYLDITPPNIVLNDAENLWPVNHKYQTFTAEEMIASLTEAGNDFPIEAAYILKVTSDEPEDANGNGDGKTLNDIVIVDCQTVDLRAERAGNGNGRVYTVHLAAQDQFGNIGSAEYQVGVAHSKKVEAIDDGVAYEVVSDCLPPALQKLNPESDETVELVEIPTEYSLYQNYPNPFNPTTRIKFDVKENSNVTLQIFDMLGREIATLVNEQKSPGSYEVNLDASQLTSGIYFYTIRANNFVQTRKMLLIK
jgi:Lamin Tail Domain/Secretion system C-terminal sorting domain/Endonuclease/Exonuclease/phosphatase family